MIFVRPAARSMHASGYSSAMRIVWKTVAITERGSASFALKLEEALTTLTDQGFSLVQMIERKTDDGLVLMFQKAVHTPEPGPPPDVKEFS